MQTRPISEPSLTVANQVVRAPHLTCPKRLEIKGLPFEAMTTNYCLKKRRQKLRSDRLALSQEGLPILNLHVDGFRNLARR